MTARSDDRTGHVPRVSVIMPTYNNASYIQSAIESVLRQTYTDWELAVVDDGSTDNTAERVSACKDGRIRYVRTRNSGASAARNRGLADTGGELVAFIDSDDIWLSHKLAVQVDVLDENPDVGLTYSRVVRITRDGRRVGSGHYALARVADGDCLDKVIVHNVLISTPTVMIRRSVLEKTGPFDESLVGEEDWDLWRRIATHWKFRYLPRILAAIRIHTLGLSSKSEDMIKCCQRVIERSFADVDVKKRLGRVKFEKLRRVAEAYYLYDCGSLHLRFGKPGEALRDYWRSLLACPCNYRQVVMLLVSLAANVPFVSSRWLWKTVRER